MKTQRAILSSLLMGALLTSVPHFASAEQHYLSRGEDLRYDYAKVIAVQPIVRRVDVTEPRQECWNEKVRNRSYRSTTYYDRGNPAGRTLAGGLIGGLIGSHLGRGRNRVATTVVGSVIGAGIGSASARSRRVSVPVETVSYERNCRTIERIRSEERIDGYRVQYKYQGEVYSTVMPYDPGKRIQVRITLTPVVTP